MSAVTAADLLDEYARALRGSYSEVEGRYEYVALSDLVATIRREGNGVLDRETVRRLRATLDVCPRGNGHWSWMCTECQCPGPHRETTSNSVDLEGMMNP